MRGFHTRSWSEQARQMVQSQVNMINDGWATIEDTIKFFSLSYRNKRIRMRAAKRFGRLVRKEKVTENLFLYRMHFLN